MSFETSGADYLRRLKQDQGQSRPFPDSTPEPAAPETAAPGERRRNPPYKCEGSATFRVQGTDVRTWGAFTDPSIGDCHIELKATFPVGAMVDLELNGVRAQVKGEVRISYPFLGMGVAFGDMTVESRQQVDAMIDTVRPSIRKAPPPSEAEPVAHASSMPIIVNAAAALQVLAEFFEVHVQLTKEEFVRLLRKSQGL